MKKRSLTLLLAGLLVCSSVFTGYSAKAEAADNYVTDAALIDNKTAEPTADQVVPNANQYRYQKEELSAFCHFGPNTFNETEWGNYGDRTAAEVFTLTNDFDAETLVSTLKEAGFEKLIVTAKHHDGFCIWDSAYTEFDVAASGYQDANGQKDILAEISAACTEYDMDMGLYLSPWDVNAKSYGYFKADGTPITTVAGRVDDALDYNEYYNNQLIEILSNDKYGNDGHFNEVWMDGANGSDSGLQYAQEYDFNTWFNTIQKYEGIEAGYDADCMLFGAEAYTTVRWIGNENGYAAEETWSKSTVNYEANTINSNSGGGYTKGFENGNQWTVPEADARITSGWFWGQTTARHTPKSIADLGNMYFGSVGHNSVLLLNVPPNNQGTVDEAILQRVTEFGNEVKDTFAVNFAENAEVSASEVRGNDIAYKPSNVIDGDDATYWTTNDGTTTGSMIVDLGETKTFDVVSIEEAIQFGQRITSFKVEYRNGDSDTWKTFDEGTTIGAKRLSRKVAVKADQLKITVSTESTVIAAPNVPMISEVGVYKASTGFELASTAPEGMEVIDIKDSGFVFSGGWTEENGQNFINGTNVWANGNTSGTVTATVNFTGSKIYLLGTLDPNHGKADIYIDDVKVATINTNSGSRALGQIIFESDTLTAEDHTLKLVASEAGKAIGLEAAYVINNDGRGMIGIEEKAYTMNEDETITVKLIRVGGSDGRAKVTLTPNPGSAVQGDFDTELIHEITFKDGETEKTATVRTKRNERETGNQYFTIELESLTDDLIIGFNAKAKITIIDEEGKTPEPEKTVFTFPTELNETKTVEAEVMELHNSGEGEAWPLQISENAWASGNQFVNAMNSGDSAILYYDAPVAGKYKVDVTFRSGDSKNSFTWSEANGKIAAGSVTMGADDGASATHVGTIEFDVQTAGKGSLTIAAGSYNAPQLDKFDITLIEMAEIPVEPPVADIEGVTRLFGSGRYETGYAVADALKDALGVEKFEAVVVATGKNFADALAGSYLAVEKNAPILLTNGKDDNVAELHAYIAANVVEGGKVYILGGEGAVPASVNAIDGYDVVRLFGDSRYDTNLEILAEAGVNGDSIIVATGKTFADSLSASAAKLPILLVKPNAALNDAQKAILADMNNIYIVGGEGAVSAAYEAELAAFGTVTRVYGDSRYDTSVEVAKTFCSDVTAAVVASGKNFPDGLCGGPLAAALDAPLVLTKDGGAGAAAGYVADNAIAGGFVLGGDGALTDATVVEVFGLESAAEIK